MRVHWLCNVGLGDTVRLLITPVWKIVMTT